MNKALETVAKRIVDITKDIKDLEQEYEDNPYYRSLTREKIRAAKDILEFNKSLMTNFLNEQDYNNAH